MLRSAELRPPKEDACGEERAASHSVIELKELPRRHPNKLQRSSRSVLPPGWSPGRPRFWGGHPSAELLFPTFPNFFICNFCTCSHIKPVCHVAGNEKRAPLVREFTSRCPHFKSEQPELHVLPTTAAEPWLQMAGRWKKRLFPLITPAVTYYFSLFRESLSHFHWNGRFISGCLCVRSGCPHCKRTPV